MENTDKSTTYDMLLGKKTTEYLKQFEGTGMYNEIAKAIQFGFHLDEEITHEMGMEVEEDIKAREPKSLDNLEERFKRDMNMVVMPLDNDNIPDEPIDDGFLKLLNQIKNHVESLGDYICIIKQNNHGKRNIRRSC